MIIIRLARHGKRNDPFYRIVAVEKGRKREGLPLDVLGHWHPKKDHKEIDKKKIKEWVSKGAKISEAVKYLMEGKVKPKKKRKKKIEESETKKEGATS